MSFEIALGDVCGGFAALRPPNRMPVSRGAALNLRVARPGSAPVNWSPRETPYMVEPVDMLGSRRHSAVCFIGGSQGGKTLGLGEGWLAHAVVNDPGDMLIVQMTQDKAREYSKQRIDRAIRNSPNLWALRGPSAKDDNLHDKQFAHGMWLRIAWPTVTNLSSTSYRYVFLTDYDRMPDDIDGEGDAFTLARARVRTFLSRGMVALETSPGRALVDPHWAPATAHEAPPVKGALGIYNTGDRRRWYWPCPHCREWFEAAPGLGLFHLPPTDQLMSDVRALDIDKFARQYARVVCPHCAAIITPDAKSGMNARGVWLPDGATIDPSGQRGGEPRGSEIASYWLGGVAAAYVNWQTLIAKELQAIHKYVMTGDETGWQSTRNTDQAVPYMARALVEAKESAGDGDHRDTNNQRFIAPAWTRFLISTVDVQGGINARFVVQVHAVGENMRQVPIDRFNIVDSLRDGVGGKAPVDPAAFAEDWDVLQESVMRRTYRVEGSEVELKPHLTVVDTGGEGKKRGKGQAAKVHEGTTANAYAWYRRLRKEGQHRRVLLVKGGSVPPTTDWLVRETDVGSKAGKGDVPLLLLNSNRLKDMVVAAARRRDGPGALLLPSWLTEAWMEEFRAEVRNEDGTWTQIRARNEAFDLCAYAIAGMLKLKIERWDAATWADPPAWALPLTDANTGLMTREERVEMRENTRVAATPAPPVARERGRLMERRTARSGYLG